VTKTQKYVQAISQTNREPMAGDHSVLLGLGVTAKDNASPKYRAGVQPSTWVIRLLGEDMTDIQPVSPELSMA
jgi:hypothetical protein